MSMPSLGSARSVPRRHAARVGLALPVLALLGGCGLDPASLPGGSYLGPTVKGGEALGTPRNAIERALALCTEKTDAAETACVRKGLVEAHVGPAALAAMIPGCRLGRSCTLTYRTRDRMGMLAATAAQYVADWLVTVDLKDPKASPADVPLTVEQI